MYFIPLLALLLESRQSLRPLQRGFVSLYDLFVSCKLVLGKVHLVDISHMAMADPHRDAAAKAQPDFCAKIFEFFILNVETERSYQVQK